MPCTCEGMAEMDNSRLRSELETVTRLLCEHLPFVPPEYRSPEVSAWWRAHEAADRAREERESASRELALKLARQVRDEAQAKIDELERKTRKTMGRDT